MTMLMRTAAAAVSVFVLTSSALAQTAAPDPLMSPAPISGASAAPTVTAPAVTSAPVRKKKPRAVAISASTPQPLPQTPWSDMPTFDAGSLDRLNGLSQFYARIAHSGGFPPAPPASLGPRSKGPDGALLRRRLGMEGDLSGDTQGKSWDQGLTTARQRYQMRNGIAATGAMNERTRAAMAVPVEKRLIQIGHNMERLGARFVDFAPRYVVVNLP